MATLTKRIEALEQQHGRVARIEDALRLADGCLTESERAELEALDWRWFDNGLRRILAEAGESSQGARMQGDRPMTARS